MNGFSDERTRIATSSPSLVQKKPISEIPTKHNGRGSYEFYQGTTGVGDSNFNEGTRRSLGPKDQEGGHFANHPISSSSYSRTDNKVYLVNQSTAGLLTDSGTVDNHNNINNNTVTFSADDNSHQFGGSFTEKRNFNGTTTANVTGFTSDEIMGRNVPFNNNEEGSFSIKSVLTSILSSPSTADSNSTNNNNYTLSSNLPEISSVSDNNIDNNSNNNSALDYLYINNISFVPTGYYPEDSSNYSCDWNLTTLCYNFSGNVTTQSPNETSSKEDLQQSYWKLFLLIFPFLTVFGNVLVCLSVYKERSLRTVTNYFIVSLAVADIMVAVFVMPLAVYVEVNVGVWTIGNIFCDTWVALDVMCCTASILNLTAISVDRFIAVTRPIQYAKHKGSNRVYLMLALVWLVSVGISSPIALGMNYTTRRIPEQCTFYNADFIIYSSMGSFYIPCVIMMLLYWRIFKAIRDRARKSVAKRPKNVDHNSFKNVIENKAHTTRTSSDASNTEENGNGNGNGNSNKRELTQVNDKQPSSLFKKPNLSHKPGNNIETSFTNYNAKFSGTDTENENNQQCFCQIEAVKSPTSEDTENDHMPDHVIANQKLLLSPTSEEDTKSEVNTPRGDDDEHSGYSAPTCVEVDISNKVLSPTSYSNKALLSPLPHRKTFGMYKEYNPNKKKKSPSKSKSEQNQNGTPKKYVTKFNFHLRHSKKKKERSTANKRERKATKTLAIVLGVFLLCWVPFFTINIMNAICIRYDLFETRPECNINDSLFSLFVWLGYINSFLNPVIYTIFNIEFRKAFKKLLKQPCK